LPYGVLNKKNTNAQWDRILPFDKLWEQYERIIKDDGAIVLFASGMFTAQLMMSNPKLWKYNWVWKKGNRPTGFLNAKKQPLRLTEDVCVFYKKQPTYNPQMTYGEKAHSKGGAGNGVNKQARNDCYGTFKSTPTVMTNEKYPVTIIDIDKEHPQSFHPTQKPVALCEYLIKTYTNEGDLVLDNCMGSGSTGVAAVNLNRNFIGIELNDEYFEIAQERIGNAYGFYKKSTITD
jgi:site-specific DNA-methyltransferase (adenine-specific)/modification methylase